MLVDAERAYRAALDLDARSAHSWHALGNVLSEQGCTAEAVAAYAEALETGDYPPNAFHVVARAFVGLGDERKSRAVLELLLDRHPSDAIARHVLAAQCDEAPVRASDACMRQEFDGFARHFDHTMEQLSYVAPVLLRDLITAALGTREGLDVADLGCGTGLLGELLRPITRSLSGVDLSPGMLSKADERGVYDTLVEGELTEFLVAHPACFDVVAAADTLIYFGPLETVVVVASSALRRGGLLGFTLEAAGPGDPDHRLSASGRYVHSPDYVRAVLEDSGFVEVSVRSEVIRSESREPVPGLIATARWG